MHPVLGDTPAFFELQVGRLARLGISVAQARVSHLAFRTASHDEYLRVRERLEAQCIANVENVWNGRPISKILLREPLVLGGGHRCALIELIPPPHQADYRTGLEHVGFALDERFADFEREFASAMSGRQFQAPDCRPYFIRFEDRTNVKFYPATLQEYCVAEGRRFDGIHHAA